MTRRIVPLLIGALGACVGATVRRYQPSVPGPPLKGPRTREVIQPP